MKKNANTKSRRTNKNITARGRFCPARSAGVLNPLTRKIVFVRPCGVRPCVCTPFPYCDFATFHFLFGNRRNRRFSNKKCVASLRPTSYLKSDDFVDFQIRNEKLQNHNKEMGYRRTDAARTDKDDFSSQRIKRPRGGTITNYKKYRH